MKTTEIVFRNGNGVPVTTSVIVAEYFEKNHKDVMAAIQDIIAMAEKSAIVEIQELKEYFELSSYETMMPGNTGAVRKYPMYIMNEEGFTHLAMGFTGEKAKVFKQRYIKAFKAMRNVIQNQMDGTAQLMQTQMQMMQQVITFCTTMQQRMDRMERYFNVGVYGSAEQVVHLKPAPRFQPSSPAMVKASGGTMRRYRTPGHLTVAEASKELVSRGVFIFQTALYRYLRENGYLCCDEQRYNLPTEMCIKNKWMIFVNAGTGVGKKHANGKRRYFTPYLSGEFVDLLERKLREMNCNDPGGYQLGLDFGKEVQE